MCGFNGIQRGNFFGRESIRRTEVEVRAVIGKLKNRKGVGKDEVTGKMVKDGGDMVVDWVCRLSNMAFESGVVPEDWRSAMTLPLYKGKWERTECKNYKGISLLNEVGEIYAGILVDKVRRMTEGLIDDEQGVSYQGGGV